MIRAWAVCCGIALLAFAAIEAPAADAKRVLLLHPSGFPLSPWSNMAASFRSEIVRRSPAPIDLHDVAFDQVRFEDRPEDEGSFVAYLRSLYSERKLDLIAPIGVPAAQFLQRHRDELFPSVPVLVVGTADRRTPEMALRPEDAAVTTPVNIPAMIENIVRLLPSTKEILVVSGQSPVEKFWLSELRRLAPPFEQVNFRWFDSLSLDEAIQLAASPPPQSAIFLFLFSLDARGVAYSEDRALDLMRSAARAPIFGVGDYQVGRGIIGGPVVQTEMIGQQAADAAIRILNGERPGDVRPPAVPFLATYDLREMRRWNIRESLLPPGSIVRFREPTAWEQYRWQIMLAAAAVAIQSLLIAGLLYQSRRRHAAEVEARRRMGELALMNRRAAIGEMSASIAHEIKQPLSAIVTNSDVGLRWLAKETPNAEQASAALNRIVNDAYRANKVVESIRSMFKKDEQSHQPTDVNDIIREVLALLRIELEAHDVSVRSALSDGPQRVLADRIQLQQVILNLVRNAIEAMTEVNGRVRVLRLETAATESGEFVVRIEDTGPGLDPDILARLFEPFVTTKVNGMGMGLSICRSIVEAHGGRLAALPIKAEGGAFEIVLPVQSFQH